MTAVPTLDAARLRLRRFTVDDQPAFEAFFADAEASRCVGGPLSRDAAWMRLCAEIGHWTAAGYGLWALEERASGAFAGATGFRKLEGWGLTELTWFVLPDFRRGGYALEASRAAIAHAYDAWGWPRVEALARDENAAARGLIAKLGGAFDRRETFPDGLARDVFRLPHPAAARDRSPA